MSAPPNAVSSPFRSGLWPLAPAGLFACLTAFWIRRVGVYPENCHLVIVAARALRGGPLPLFVNYKTGPGGFLWFAPFVLAFGQTARTLRAASVFWSAASVAATGVLAERCSGSRRAGVLAACLAAASPAWTGFTPAGAQALFPVAALAAASLAAMIACARARSPGLARLAGLLLGLALTTHSVAVGIVAGLAVYAFLNRERFGPAERRLVAQGAPFFAAPLLPYLWALTAGGLWRFWLGSLLTRDRDHRSNLAYLPGAIVRLRHLALIVSQWPDSPPPAWFSSAAAACAAGLLGIALWRFARAAPGARRPAAFLWTLAACFFALSPFSPSKLSTGHLVPAMPILWAAVAASLALAPSDPARRAGALLALAYLAAASAGSVIFAGRVMRSAGAGTHYDRAILDMARYFAARPELSPVFLTGTDGSWSSVMVLFATGRVPQELSTDDHSPAGEADWKSALGNPASVFVDGAPIFRMPESEEPARRRAARGGYRFVETVVIRDGLGAPAYRLWTARRRAALSARR